MWLPLEPRQSIPGAVNTTHGPGEPLDYCDRKFAGLPTGPIPNQGPRSAAIIWTFVALSTIFVILRVYCKIWRSRGLWWDDHILLVSWALFLGVGIICQRVIDHGFGMYPCDINPEYFPLLGFEGSAIGSTFSLIATSLSKTSFAVTMLRLTKGKTYAFVWVIIVLVNATMATQVVFTWVKCTPVTKNWMPFGPGHCWDVRITNGFGVFSGALSGGCDILLALLPWHLVWALRMKTKEKVGVIVAMSMGVFAGAIAFVKAAQIPLLGSKNFSYDGCLLIVWSAVEIGTTIMACCIPVLRVFFRDLHETTLLHYRGSKATPNSKTNWEDTSTIPLPTSLSANFSKVSNKSISAPEPIPTRTPRPWIPILKGGMGMTSTTKETGSSPSSSASLTSPSPPPPLPVEIDGDEKARTASREGRGILHTQEYQVRFEGRRAGGRREKSVHELEGERGYI